MAGDLVSPQSRLDDVPSLQRDFNPLSTAPSPPLRRPTVPWPTVPLVDGQGPVDSPAPNYPSARSPSPPSGPR
jgi:hypothetical protein